MAFARVNGIVLHHDVRGGESAPALVFSNPPGTDFRIRDEVAAALGDRYRIVLYDSRGHGLSEAPPPPYSMDDHACVEQPAETARLIGAFLNDAGWR